MRSRCLLILPALVAALLLAPVLEAHAAKQATPEQLTIADRAMRLAITSGTDRYPVGLRKACMADTLIIVRCRTTWRDSRNDYAGRFFIVDEGDAVIAVFAGIATDRRCMAKAKDVKARRACRTAMAF